MGPFGLKRIECQLACACGRLKPAGGPSIRLTFGSLPRTVRHGCFANAGMRQTAISPRDAQSDCLTVLLAGVLLNATRGSADDVVGQGTQEGKTGSYARVRGDRSSASSKCACWSAGVRSSVRPHERSVASICFRADCNSAICASTAFSIRSPAARTA